MKRGKCQNFSGCLLAYRGEEIEVRDDEAFVCPECSKPLIVPKSFAGSWAGMVVSILLLLLIAGGAYFAWMNFGKQFFRSGTAAAPTPAAVPDSKAPEATPAPGPAPAEPPATVAMPAKIDLDLAKGENRKAKREVLDRVDSMPITAVNKDKLYNSVETAKQMGKLLTIPFASGGTSLSAANLEALKTELQKPELAPLREDPTAVFVILGFADPKGDPKKNIQISQQRADAVLMAMRDKCGVVNVLHAVAMGGSTLVDAQNLEKNRIVEVWAVLP